MNIKQLLVASAVVLAATVPTTANIITPITLSLVNTMNFGSIAVSPAKGGTVILSPFGARTATGGVIVLHKETAGAANFTLSGMADYTFSITLPAYAILTDNAHHAILMNAFTCSPASTGTLSPIGTQTISIGATIIIAAAQAPNSYTNSTEIPVTINYN